jgi:hypothetical protein
VSAIENVLHDPVAMLLGAGEGEQDVEPMRFQRNKFQGIGLGYSISISNNIDSGQ